MSADPPHCKAEPDALTGPQPSLLLAPATAPLRRDLYKPVAFLAALAGIAALWLGRDFLIPLVASITLAALLNPMVRKLTRVLRSRLLAVLLALMMTVLASVALGSVVFTQVAGTTDRMPDVLRLAARDIADLGPIGGGTLQRTRQALGELERSIAKVTGAATTRIVSPSAAAAAASPTMVAEATVWTRQQVLLSTRTTLGVLLQMGAIVLLSFFLLCSGEILARSVSRWLEEPRRGVARLSPLMLEAAHQVRLYAGVMTVTNAVIGLMVAAGFTAFGVPQPWAWGVAAAVLHIVPYAGMAVVMLLAFVEVYAAQASLAAALLACAYVAVIGTVVGTLMAAWLQGKASRIDSALVLIGTVFWSALWGGWGLVLGPMLVVVASIAWPYVTRAHTQAQSLADGQSRTANPGDAPPPAPAAQPAL